MFGQGTSLVLETYSFAQPSNHAFAESEKGDWIEI